MNKLLAAEPNNTDAIDNLAVALFRIGQVNRAIDVLADKERRFPDRYTTASNLATICMLTGHCDRAIPLLEKALRINPYAHFGREKYQLELAKFLVAKQTKPSTRPVDDAEDFLSRAPFTEVDIGDFDVDIHARLNAERGPRDISDDDQKAINAIVGMIRFGTDQSPDLYYALGNALLNSGDRFLAMRASSRAADLRHPLADAIRAKLIPEVNESIIDSIRDTHLDATIAAERTAGDAWSQAYMDFADGLIRSGKTPMTNPDTPRFTIRMAARPNRWASR